MVSFFDIKTVLFTIGKQPVSYLEVACLLSGLVCIFLAVRAKVANFWFGYLYNILLFPLFLQKGLYSSMLLQPISFAINIFGHYRWTHPRANEEDRQHELKITQLSHLQRLLLLALIAVLTVAWGFVIANLPRWIPGVRPALRPFLDAFVMIMVLTAQFLAAQKKLDCWAAWMTVNVTNVTLYSLSGLLFLAFESLTKIVMASFGFVHWWKKYQQEKWSKLD
jgi:nicotinamide mononucleotide transporter